jgi:hypothetical protein
MADPLWEKPFSIMTAIFIERVGLRNYKSIARCDVPLARIAHKGVAALR